MSFIGGLGQGIGDSFSRAFMQARGMSADRKRDAQMMAFRNRAFAEQVSAREAADARAEKSDAATAAYRGKVLEGQRQDARLTAGYRTAETARKKAAESSSQAIEQKRLDIAESESRAAGEARREAAEHRSLLVRTGEERRKIDDAARQRAETLTRLNVVRETLHENLSELRDAYAAAGKPVEDIKKLAMTVMGQVVLNSPAALQDVQQKLAVYSAQHGQTMPGASRLISRLKDLQDTSQRDSVNNLLRAMKSGKDGTQEVTGEWTTNMAAANRSYLDFGRGMTRKDITPEEWDHLSSMASDSFEKAASSQRSVDALVSGGPERFLRGWLGDGGDGGAPPVDTKNLHDIRIDKTPNLENVEEALPQAMLKEMSKKSRDAFARAWDFALREGDNEKTLHEHVVERYNREGASGEGWLALDDDDQFLLLPTAKDLGVKKKHLHEYYRKKFSDSGSAQSEIALLRERGNLVGNVTKDSLKKAMGERDVERSLPGRALRFTRGVSPFGKINRVQEVLDAWSPSGETVKGWSVGTPVPITRPYYSAKRLLRAAKDPGREIPFIN